MYKLMQRIQLGREKCTTQGGGEGELRILNSKLPFFNHNCYESFSFVLPRTQTFT